MKYVLFLAFLYILNASFSQQVLSPNGKIKADVLLRISSGEPYMTISYQEDGKFIPIVKDIKLGLLRNDGDFSANLKLLAQTSKRKISDSYITKHGKRKVRTADGIECIYHFSTSQNKKMDLILRLYNDGIAFRYTFPEKDTNNYQIIDDATTFSIPENSHSWMQPFNGSYEDFYNSDKDSTHRKPATEWGFPSLFSVAGDSAWMLISEAGLSRYNAATRLSSTAQPYIFKIALPYSKNESYNIPGNWSSQWRVLIIGKLNDIVSSTLIEDVNEPSRVANIDFVKPGAVSWNYWAYNHGTQDYKRVCEYIDLAVKMKWPYTLLDWEWDHMQNGGNLEDAVKYARSKGIKPLMWYNSGKTGNTPVGRLNTHEDRIKEFEWLNQLGIYGIKVDFFDDDKVNTIAYYLDILEDAARYKLMVDFHGATVPKGWARTYPNLMTTEAVYGAEWYNNGPVLTTKAAWHNTVLPFTRNVVGAMDYTPVTFTNSQYPHTTTYGHELALSVAFESALQHFADRPAGYLQLPDTAIKFLQEVPVTWDDIKLVSGYPGESVVLARRNLNKWYISGLNGKDKEALLELNFKYLSPGEYTLTLISDGATDKQLKIENIPVNRSGKLAVKCLPRGGFTGYIQKVSH
jgi:hypothetical protein